ncbi:glucose-6-phosphate 1-epimerase [Sphaerochaeta associata]|uniref:Putative glucose-6-phosphate 1-epimerase n=1 Tax=Sphaerochaeta associata TaxID=1129264 RepID=A0ABY4D8M2_9SPIR|nr:D-hexose-6-phosphate mutarotase [Sphaerochaeta associata]UOM50643.1 D-hexose-6-phosphate mutarotase [Sphaerochaeta associata]SMP39931.1 glucose-6-phosphate 1-epimerase [Sphaerochaeta associata]
METAAHVHVHQLSQTVRMASEPAGLSVLLIENEQARCLVYLQGAHVASFTPNGQGNLLFMSPYSAYEKGKPFRGGIPICFPWFGKHPKRDDLYLHGLVRTKAWELREVNDIADGSTKIILATEDDECTRSIWPHRFSLQLTITVAAFLRLELQVTNADEQPISFEEAFHTYFHIGSLPDCSITGLEGCPVVDRADGNREYSQNGLVFVGGEFVRIFEHAGPVVVLHDPILGRTIRMEQENLKQVFVWNPGDEKARQNPEVLDAWKDFVCVEQVNSGKAAVVLEKGRTHQSTLQISSLPYGNLTGGHA